MSNRFLKQFRPTVLVFACCIATECIAQAQQPTQTLEPIQVTGRIDDAQVSPLDGVPLSQTPISATVIDAKRLRASGATRLADVTNHEAGLSDAYNTVGYWDALTLRGLVLDNRSSFRREGLPISAETSIALFNKERIEILKGASGFASGVAVPAGAVNYRVKRPVAELRQADFRADGFGGASLAVDLSEKTATWGLRANAMLERLSGPQAGTKGEGKHLALAASWQLSASTRIDLETESSRRSQPSVPGQSLWGNAVPQPAPKANPAEQPWMLPVVFEGQTSSLRIQQRLNEAWLLQYQVQTQSLPTDDRTVFPFGCSAANGNYFADRFCPDGSADFYDYRSENERRTSRGQELALSGAFTALGLPQRIKFNLLQSALAERYQPQAYNYIGTALNTAPGVLLQDPSATDPTTLRDETSREWALAHSADLGSYTAWWGLRSTQIQRSSVRSNGSRPGGYGQSLATPWAAFSHRLNPHTTLYASRSSGAESEVVPNRSRYTNAGAVLPALLSWQTEVGIKFAAPATQASAAWYRIRRPVAADFGVCAGMRDCTRAIDGSALHQGIELAGQHRLSVSEGLGNAMGAGTWRVGGSFTHLLARREASAQAGINGLAPTNVPQTSLRASASHTPKAEPRLSVDAQWIHESARQALPDNSIQIPSWQRVDLGAQWRASAAWQISAGIENVGDSKAFRESPFQFGHSYLFNLAPRRFKLGLSFNG